MAQMVNCELEGGGGYDDEECVGGKAIKEESKSNQKDTALIKCEHFSPLMLQMSVS